MNHAFDGIAELERMARDGRALVADLIGQTLTRSGHHMATEGAAGFRVKVGRSKYDGYLTVYYVECTDLADLELGVLYRYAKDLTGAGWFVEEPGPLDDRLCVEVIEDAILDRAPEWLCERWEAIHSA